MTAMNPYIVLRIKVCFADADDTSIYFISHGKDPTPFLKLQLTVVVLEPTWKLSYVQVAWHVEYVEDNMDRLREIVGPLSISTKPS